MFESERRDLAWVPRWGIVRVLRRQSVAEHSYYVTCYGLEVAKAIGWPECDPAWDATEHPAAMHLLSLYLLRHDEGESVESDAPGPVKRIAGWDSSKLAPLLRHRFGPPPYCTTSMRKIRVVADLIDECMYLAGEIRTGNGSLNSVYVNSLNRLVSSLELLPGGTTDVTLLKHRVLTSIADEFNNVKDMSGLEGV